MTRHDAESQPLVALFDIGGVIVTDGPRIDQVAYHMGIDLNEPELSLLEKAIWKHRDDYDLGQDDASYWLTVASEMGISSLEPATIDHLVHDDVCRWSDPDPILMRCIEKLHDDGIICAVLSNAPTSYAHSFSAQPWVQRCFSHLLFSCEIGLLKPEDGIYRTAIETIDCPAERITFFDDRSANVEAAYRCGLNAHLWEGIPTLSKLFPIP